MRPRWPQFVALAFATACASAAPPWVRATPEGFVHDFASGTGSGPTANAAEAEAVTNALVDIARRGLLSIELSRGVDSTIVVETLGRRGSEGLSRRATSVQELVLHGAPVAPGALEVFRRDVRRTERGFEAYVLLRFDKHAGLRAVPGRSAIVWRSVVLPGWGQFTKGEPRKGATILAGTAVCAMAALGATLIHADARRAALASTVQTDGDRLTATANRARDAALGAGAGAIAWWSAGVLDAAVSPMLEYASGRVDVGLRVAGR